MRESAASDVSRETHDRLDAFVALLARWQKTVRLVAAGSPRDIWPRHIEDSLQLAPLVPAGTSRAIDLGSGAGFPGLVLAIATGVHFSLVERDRRKAAFLLEAVRITGAPASVHAVAAERSGLAPERLITVRALATIDATFALAAPLLARDGIVLLLKGKNVQVELQEAARRWRMRARLHASAVPGNGYVVEAGALEP